MFDALIAYQPADDEPELDEPTSVPGKRTLTGRLPRRLAARASAALGHDLSRVTVHEDGAAERLGVRAFASGDALHFAAGAYRPDTAAGVALIGHELAHVAQQREGRVAVEAVRAGMSINADPALERAADQAGAALAGGFDLDEFAAFGVSRAAATGGPAPTVAQGFGLGWPIGCAPRSTAPATDAAALTRWRAGHDRFTRLYRAGLAYVPPATETTPSRATLFRNACQWIDAGEVQVVLLARAAAPRQSPADDLYFGEGNIYPATQPDPSQVSAGDDFPYASTWGICDGTTLWLIDLIDGAWTDDTIKDTVIHEVQHDADGGPGDEFNQDNARAERYQTEFRARWIEPDATADYGDPLDPPDPSLTIEWPHGSGTTIALTGFANRRQQGIFKTLADDTGGGYAFIPRLYASKLWFRRMVRHFTIAAGGNLVDSVRIQRLTQLIVANEPAMNVLTVAATSLDSVDCHFLADRAAAADFWATASRHLDAALVGQLGWLVDHPATYRAYAVVAGDTLSLIAERLLGDADRWHEVYDQLPANQAVIGADPDRIEPGQVLLVPRA